MITSDSCIDQQNAANSAEIVKSQVQVHQKLRLLESNFHRFWFLFQFRYVVRIAPFATGIECSRHSPLCIVIDRPVEATWSCAKLRLSYKESFGRSHSLFCSQISSLERIMSLGVVRRNRTNAPIQTLSIRNTLNSCTQYWRCKRKESKSAAGWRGMKAHLAGKPIHWAKDLPNRQQRKLGCPSCSLVGSFEQKMSGCFKALSQIILRTMWLCDYV